MIPTYTQLLPYVISTHQRALLDYLITHVGVSPSQAGCALGMDEANARRAIRNLCKRAGVPAYTEWAMPPEEPKMREDLYCPECGTEGMVVLRGKSETGRTRYECPACKLVTVRALYQRPQLLPPTRVAHIRRHTRFVITSAVNDTPLVTDAHETFRNMADSLGACYLIIPGTYRNTDLTHQGVQQGYTWPEEILPYLCNVDVELSPVLTIRGGASIQYTAINPLAGMNHAGSICSEIFAHPQVAMELVATSKQLLPKMLHTTGSISQRNYTRSKQGHKAAFHHSISALFVEVEGDRFWTHEVHYDGTGAYLFDRYYTSAGSEASKGVAGIVFGDLHLRHLGPATEAALDDLAGALCPEKRIYHDIHDQHIGSHHTEHDVIAHLANAVRGEYSVRTELERVAHYLYDKPGSVIVDSNHHRHLANWFNRFRPMRDPVNADLYFELGEMARLDLRAGGDGNLLRLYLSRYCPAELEWLSPDELYTVAGVDCSQHGDRGPNGSRGSARGFAATGHKTIIGHSHTPRIEKGCYQVGVAGRGNYAQGYSSWLGAHCIIYRNGKRGLISVLEDKLPPVLRP